MKAPAPRLGIALLLSVCSAAFAQSPLPCVPLTNGMVGWWQAQNNALDSSGLGHHGTLQGEAGFTGGIVGRAFAFPGTDTPAGVRIAATPALNVGTGDGFTLDAWIRVSQVEIGWPSRAGQMYQVQYRTNAPAGPWLPLGLPVPGNGTTNYVLDGVAPGEPRRVYRVEER